MLSRLRTALMLLALTLGTTQTSPAQTIVARASRGRPDTVSFSGLKYTLRLEDTAAVAPDEGFWPFKGSNRLQQVYDSDLFASVRELSLSGLVGDSAEAQAVFADVISFIPEQGWFRAAISVELTKEELKDTTQTQKDIALQKILNGGGNIALTFSRPVLYYEVLAGFLLLDVRVSGFVDIPAVNTTVYDPGAGLQARADLDLRIVNAGTARQDGNFFRLGGRSRGIWSAFNADFEDDNPADNAFRDKTFATVEIYAGLGPINLEYAFNLGPDVLLEGRRRTARITVVPVKF